ncbi:MAG: hypothetical protein ACQET7_02015 [Thermodesulfobacteriota bacterium]
MRIKRGMPDWVFGVIVTAFFGEKWGGERNKGRVRGSWLVLAEKGRSQGFLVLI